MIAQKGRVTEIPRRVMGFKSHPLALPFSETIAPLIYRLNLGVRLVFDVGRLKPIISEASAPLMYTLKVMVRLRISLFPSSGDPKTDF
jgi:hypothetical protein